VIHLEGHPVVAVERTHLTPLFREILVKTDARAEAAEAAEAAGGGGGGAPPASGGVGGAEPPPTGGGVGMPLSGIRHDDRSNIMNSRAFSGPDRSRVITQLLGKVPLESGFETTAVATCRPVKTNRPH